jgi:hypothetical protein
MTKPTKEIREEDGTLVITEKDAPAGMGAIYPEDLSECQGEPEEKPKNKPENMVLEFITKDSFQDENELIIRRINAMMRECFPLIDYEIRRRE